jgi:hypothetical protein
MALLGQALRQGGLMHCWQVEGTWNPLPPVSPPITSIRGRITFFLPACLVEQAVSQSLHPSHLIGSMDKTLRSNMKPTASLLDNPEVQGRFQPPRQSRPSLFGLFAMMNINLLNIWQVGKTVKMKIHKVTKLSLSKGAVNNSPAFIMMNWFGRSSDLRSAFAVEQIAEELSWALLSSFRPAMECGINCGRNPGFPETFGQRCPPGCDPGFTEVTKWRLFQQSVRVPESAPGATGSKKSITVVDAET